MAGGTFGEVARQVHRLYNGGTVAGLGEAQLLERFLALRDEASFEALMARHGPMVLAVCRRVLRDDHAADDAFQATFLVLVRKAGSIRGSDLLGPWLHRVAYRVSVRAGQARARRLAKEIPSPDALERASAAEPSDGDLTRALHEVLDGLPEKYRAPVVLCYLEGHTHDEAARRLRWPIGSVKGRLSRAKELMKTRLVRRGLTVPAGAIAAALGREASAAVSVPLRDTTIRAATSMAAGQTIAAGLISASVGILVREATTTMMIKKLGALAAGLAALSLLAGGAAVMARQEGGPSPEANAKPAPEAQADGKTTDDAKPADKATEAPVSPEVKADLDRLQGRWVLTTADQGGPGARAAFGATPLDPLEQIAIRGATLYTIDDSGELSSPRSLRLEPSASPKRFEWRRKALGGAEETTRGIYRIVEDGFSLCFDTNAPLTAPTAFDLTVSPEAGRRISSYRRAAKTAEESDEVREELRKLQGTWAVAAVEKDGEEDKEMGRNSAYQLVIQKNALSYRQLNGALAGEQRITPVLSETPHVLELRPPSKLTRQFRSMQGAMGAGFTPLSRWSYKLDGDTLVTCTFSSTANRPDVAPGELVTRPGDQRILTVYRRSSPNPPFVTSGGSRNARTVPANLPEAKAPPTPPAEVKAVAPSPDAPRARATPGGESVPGKEVAEKLANEILGLTDRRDSLEIDNEIRASEMTMLREQVSTIGETLARAEILGEGNAPRAEVRPPSDADLQRRDALYLKLKESLAERKTALRKLIQEDRGKKRELSSLTARIADLTAKEAEARSRPGMPGTIQARDTLVIEVLEALPGRPLTGERIVRPDGTISLGFYGDLPVAGLTRGEIKEKLIAHLRKYLKDDALGLVVANEQGEVTRVAPADSDRVFVDDSPAFSAPAGANSSALERKLDAVIRELEALKQSPRPVGTKTKGR